MKFNGGAKKGVYLIFGKCEKSKDHSLARSGPLIFTFLTFFRPVVPNLFCQMYLHSLKVMFQICSFLIHFKLDVI